MKPEVKLKKLKAHLRRLSSVLVAYSGGVDSSFLLKAALDVLGEKVLAVTALSETYPSAEAQEARALAGSLGARHLLIHTQELKDPSFRKNPTRRCYYCKKELFAKLKSLAGRHRLNAVIDGSNADDLSDYRPGALAKKELGVISPLQEARLEKNEIRALSKKMNLATWRKPALACLASRIPYHSRITKKRLERIEKAEDLLRQTFRIKGNLRVRDFGVLAKVEVDRHRIRHLSQSGDTARLLRTCGFEEVVVDPRGYRCGSMNEGLKGR